MIRNGKSITLVKNDNNMLPIQNNEKTVIVVPYANEVLSGEYAISKLKEDGIVSEDIDISVYLMNGKELSEIKENIKNATNVLLVTEQYSQGALAGASYSKIDEIIDYVHEQGNKIACVSCYLPYDSARLQKADSILLAYSAKGMNELPNFASDLVQTYGVSIPCSLYTAFDKNAKLGKLPVNIPKLDENFIYTSEYLYKRNYGLQYEINEEIGDEEDYLKPEDFGEEVDRGSKTLNFDFTNNKYKISLFSSPSESDLGFLYKNLLEPLFSDDNSADFDDEGFTYFNIVDGKIVPSTKEKSIFKLIIYEDEYDMEILPTTNEVEKTTTTAKYDKILSAEYQEGKDSSHVRYGAYNVTVNFVYGTKAVEDNTAQYKVLEGAGQTIEISENKEITFRFDIEYSKFQEGGKVYIDDKIVDSKYYTSKSGSTIITFNADYVKTLSEGNHTLKVAVADGEVSTTFKVANTTNTETNNETTTNTETNNETTTNTATNNETTTNTETNNENTTNTETKTTAKTNNPKTGDSIPTILTIFVIATIGAFITIKFNRNQKC